MRMSAALHKRLLLLLAVVFAAATIAYSGIWMYSVIGPAMAPVELGIETDYDPAQHCQFITLVHSGSPAAQAGLQEGDCVLALNGILLATKSTMEDVYFHERPGDAAELTVERSGLPAPIALHGTFRSSRFRAPEVGTTERLLSSILNGYPLLFLVIGLAVLFLRLEDRNAWLLALLFGSFVASPQPAHWSADMGPALQRFVHVYRAVLDTHLGALFYFFFAVFPVRSPLDRRAPWVKWLGFLLGLAFWIPGLDAGDPRSPKLLVAWVGQSAANVIRLGYLYGFVVLGLISLVATAHASSTPPEARRKTRVILWGTLIGMIPILILKAAMDFLGFHPPYVLYAGLALLMFLFPLSFGYAVVKHRVLEIPILLKRSARYLVVQRGFTVLLFIVSVGTTLFIAIWFARYLHTRTQAATPSGFALGAAFGTLLLWTGARVHKNVGGRMDRAFFRSAYDARQVLENLAQKSRQARQREPLAELLVMEINAALHPGAVAVYFLAERGKLKLEAKSGRDDIASFLSSDLPLLKELQLSGKPQEAGLQGYGISTPPPDFGGFQPECLVPLPGADGRLAGVIALGLRLSEESYSREDKRLLASVASQASVALEAIQLGEEIAERIAAERRSAQEMEFAREVQARLFPQKLPPLASLEYAGTCIPARDVGGDYYDFLELRPGRVAMVLADIAGKGVSGALLMANLQANLRSQYAAALDDLPRLLNSVNHLFFENTSPSSYATLFLGDYDDSTRRLRYVNCGHLPPLLLRAAGNTPEGQAFPGIVERLEATGTVVGLFDKWDCAVKEVQLAPGDTLVLYTDGVTEAEDKRSEEFGEVRLTEFLRANFSRPPAALIEPLVAAVHEFSAGEQADDITLVVARCRA